jgi:ABC-type polysaccharide/polyol phosphate export permease
MRDTIISAMVMAAISGLTFIAYKHPKGYTRIYFPVMICGIAVFLLYATFCVGYIHGFSDSSIGYLKLNPPAIHSPVSEIGSPTIWDFLIPVLFVGYLTFLQVLPSILDLPTKDDDKDKPKDKVSEKGSDNDA